MLRKGRLPVPAEHVFCSADRIAIGISELYVSLGKKPYCISHARALIRKGEAEAAEFVLLSRGNEQDEKMRDDLLSAAVRARIITEKPKTASP